LGVRVPEAVTIRTQEHGDDGSIPDLVGVDSSGKELIILEAKFDAWLTDNQPVAYLKRLPPDSAAILLFVAPAQKSVLLWTEVVSRCRKEGLPIGIEQPSNADVLVRTVGTHHVLAMTSWRHMLAHLLNAMSVEGDQAAISDLRQLQGLCDRMDAEAFQPFRSEELNPSIGARNLQFNRLVDDTASSLAAKGLAKVVGSASSAMSGYYLRPIAIHDFHCGLLVSWEYWARKGSTPIWLSVKDAGGESSRVARDALLLLQVDDPPRLFDGEWNNLLVPMRLPLGVERQQVIDGLVEQVCEVADLLAKFAQ
jgi:hypothetical protein